MSMMKQTALLAAGCQPWNTDVCAACGDRFAYCATLAVYIYQLDRTYNEFKLHSIMSEHKKTITAISWHTNNVDLLASCGADLIIIVWNVVEQRAVFKLDNIKAVPSCIGWCDLDRDTIAFVCERGPLFMWNIKTTEVNVHKEAQNFSRTVCQFRWHHTKKGKLVFGHTDGTISLFFLDKKKNQKHVLAPDEDDDDDDPVTGLEWDPLSSEYLLIANHHYGVRLVDTETLATIMTFNLPSAAARTQTVSWIHSAPGMFLTGDANSGVMRLWNVSKSTPIESIKLKKMGFHALHVFNTSLTSGKVKGQSLPNLEPSTNSARFALPPAHAVCTFRDGGVGLYDLGKRRWDFLRDLGHVETIFDCKFQSNNPDHLATASFDGTIKIWDINTMSALHTSPGNEGVIYCLSWAPSDLNCIAASTSRHGTFIWDINKGKITNRFSEHGKSSVYSVAWCHKDSRRLATCGADGYCIIRHVDGELLHRYKHPAAVFGCDWSPNNKDMIATGCDDKLVRVFYLATTTSQPLKSFSGHTAKVFQVKWSPLREGILCSGSDDGTIRIWDYTQDSCIQVLCSHSAPVRGLLWNTEIPYLLVSGSWDYSIRMWDTRDGACLDTVLDHGADVYGLSSHPRRPFVLASCSRDSTLRIWSLLPLIQPLEMNIIAKRSLSDIVALPEQAMSTGHLPLLAGRVSKEVKLCLDNSSQGDVDTHCQTLKSISKFFRKGVESLWELVSVVNGMDDSLLSQGYKKGIMHVKHLTRFKGSEARELEIVMATGLSSRSRTREDVLMEAANIHIRLGNVKNYCEILVGLGQWEKALSVAPGASMDYWQSLVERYVGHLVKQDREEAVPYCVAAGDAVQLVDLLVKHGHMQDAMLTATAAHEGSINCGNTEQAHNGHVNGVKTSKDVDKLLHDTSCRLADWYFRNGSAITAACCHLAVDDCELAISKLIRGNELELAVGVGTVLKKGSALTGQAVEYLARRCERLAKWDLAVDLLKTIEDNDKPLVRVCARCSGTLADINSIHERCGLPNLDECLKKAEELSTEPNVYEAVKYYLISVMPVKGLSLGMKYIKECLRSSSWTLDNVLDILQLLGSIRTDVLQQTKCSSERSELLAISAYVGALLAIRRMYDAIVPALFYGACSVLQQDSPDVPLTTELCNSELEAWRQFSPTRSKSGAETSGKPELKSVYDNLMRKCGTHQDKVMLGPDFVTGSNLPSHSDVHHSYFTRQRIQGDAFFLEDGQSAISINEALMWAKVNPFSPLLSGVRINPF